MRNKKYMLPTKPAHNFTSSEKQERSSSSPSSPLCIPGQKSKFPTVSTSPPPLPFFPAFRPALHLLFLYSSICLPHERKPTPLSPPRLLASGVVVRLGLHTTNSYYLHVGSFVFPCHLTIRRGETENWEEEECTTYVHTQESGGRYSED